MTFIVTIFKKKKKVDGRKKPREERGHLIIFGFVALIKAWLFIYLFFDVKDGNGYTHPWWMGLCPFAKAVISNRVLGRIFVIFYLCGMTLASKIFIYFLIRK